MKVAKNLRYMLQPVQGKSIHQYTSIDPKLISCPNILIVANTLYGTLALLLPPSPHITATPEFHQ